MISKTLSLPQLEARMNNTKDLDEKLEYASQIINLSHTISSYNNRGIIYMLKGDYEKAELDFDTAIRIFNFNPRFVNCAALYYNRGYVRRQLKQYSGALIDFDIALQKSSRIYNCALLNRGLTYYALGSKEKALTDFEKALKATPDILLSDLVRNEDFEAIIDTFGYKDALPIFDKVIEKHASDKLYFFRGYAKAFLDDFDGATADFEMAFKTNPDLMKDVPFTHHNRAGEKCLRSGDYTKALEHFNDAIESCKNLKTTQSALPFNNRGYLYLILKKFDLALADFDEAIRRDPSFSIAYGNRGDLYLLTDRIPLAMKDYAKAIELDDGNAYAYSGRAKAYLNHGNFSAAVADYQKCLKLLQQKNSPYEIDKLALYKDMSTALLKLKKRSQALDTINHALEINDKDCEVYTIMAAIFFAKHKYNDAITHCNTAIKLNPDTPNCIKALKLRADSYACRGSYEASLADYEQALTLDPNNVEVLNNRGIVYEKLGRWEEQIADYEKILKIAPESYPSNNVAADYIQWINYAKKQLGDTEFSPALAKYKKSGVCDRSAAQLIHNQHPDETTLEIPDWVRKISSGAFENQDWICVLKISKNVQYIENNSFKNCKNLDYIDFLNADSLDVIEQGAFDGCVKLRRANVPSECEVEDGAFPQSCKVKMNYKELTPKHNAPRTPEKLSVCEDNSSVISADKVNPNPFSAIRL